MRKKIILSLLLIVIDQAIKLFIWFNYMKVDIVLLQGILFFRPIQNTNLNFIASIVEYQIPVILMVIIQIPSLIIIFLCYRYLLYLWVNGKNY